jgi:N-acetylglucosamine-6-phosphate deacetylase
MTQIIEIIDNPEYTIIQLEDIAGFYGDYVIAIINGTVINADEEPKIQDIILYKDKITDSVPENVKHICVIDAKDMTITAGLIDQHIHGGYGVDFNTATVEEILHFTANLPEHGVTSILATIMTAPDNVIKKQIGNIKQAVKNQPENSTKILGVHLEGPYLSQKYKGIQPEKDISSPNTENFKKIEDEIIKMVSYSPELDENFELTKYFSSKNIIPSAGHTGALQEQIKEACSYGLKQITHTFNAMPALHHRTPGIIGEALTNDDLYTEIIADGVHVHPTVVELVIRAKPDSKIIFISDSLPLTETKTDSVVFGGHEIFKKDDMAVNKEGTMAGSLIFLDSALKKFVSSGMISFSQFMMFTSLNIAENLGIDDLGLVKKGCNADIVIWNKDFQPELTIINGKIAFKKP